MTKLRAIYDKDINRAINPAVVVSNKKKETVDAEIKEYIFTTELIEKLYKLLNTVLNVKSGKTGIWINGYYGSGKSHFIKYAHYCLNPDYSEEAFNHYITAVESYDATKAGANDDITPSNIALLRKRIAKSNCDNIMFNVEDETSDGEGERLTRVFLDMFNKFRGYNSDDIPLALLFEKYLDRKGKFEAFKQLVSDELEYDWKKDAAQVAAFELESILQIGKRLVPEMDIVALHGKLSNPDAFKISIRGTLIPELQEFVKDKDPNYRLLFLVDEVSQYIGTNKEILLNFQNIVERVSEDCNNQVWIACTAQQTLDEVSTGTDATVNIQDEFGKILGRFDTRISLQSNDASFITQKRVLDKNSTGIKELGEMYQNKKDYIENQFKINHELYKGYTDIENFTLAYPFVPYQFKLIAHVFEAFQQLGYVIKEVKDNERSVLGITHYTAKKHADDEVGVFMPFDAFYNQQFRTNLTHRGTRAVENAMELPYVKAKPFAVRVVKTLFMISNLLESQRQTFPSNLDNLTVLMMTKLDENRRALQNEIKEVLDKLIEESIIREEKGNYYFFNEDEIDVQNIIKNTSVGIDDRLVTFDQIFRPMTRITHKFGYGHNDFKVGYSVDGKEFLRNGDFNIIVLVNDHTPLSQKALEINSNDLAVGVNEWFMTDETLKKDFIWYCKTNKFFQNNSTNSLGERGKTLDNFRVRNKSLETSIAARFKDKFATTRFVSKQRIIEADEINGSSPVDRIKNVQHKHLEAVYKNHLLSTDYARNTQQLKAEAASNQLLTTTLTPAEELVNDYISSFNNEISVQDLIANFSKVPFGWREEALLHILVHLVKKKKREFMYRNQKRYSVVNFINKAISRSEQPSCHVCSGEDIDQSTLDATLLAYKTIFNVELKAVTDGNELYENLLIALGKEQDRFTDEEEKYYGNYPFGNIFHTVTEQINKWQSKRDPKTLFSTLRDVADTAKEDIDKAKRIADFMARAKSDYDGIRKYYNANSTNFSQLGPDAEQKADEIGIFLKADDPTSDFRHIIKAYKEVKAALEAYQKQLVGEVVEVYNRIFEVLDAEAATYKVEASVYANQENKIAAINRLTSITQLNNVKLSASRFKKEQLGIIINFAAKRQEEAEKADAETANGDAQDDGGNPGYNTGTKVKVKKSVPFSFSKIKASIKTEEELNTFLEEAKERMLKILENNTIIIE